MSDEFNKKWGPYCWFIIHTFSITNNFEDTIELIKILSDLLPCKKCCNNLKKKIKIGCLNYSIKETPFILTYKLHDKVNKCLNKLSPLLLSSNLYYKSQSYNDIRKKLWFFLFFVTFYIDKEHELISLRKLFKLFNSLQPNNIFYINNIKYWNENDLFDTMYEISTYKDIDKNKYPKNKLYLFYDKMIIKKKCDSCSINS